MDATELVAAAVEAGAEMVAAVAVASMEMVRDAEMVMQADQEEEVRVLERTAEVATRGTAMTVAVEAETLSVELAAAETAKGVVRNVEMMHPEPTRKESL